MTSKVDRDQTVYKCTCGVKLKFYLNDVLECRRCKSSHIPYKLTPSKLRVIRSKCASYNREMITRVGYESENG
jgi:hypothetical protein